MKLGLVFGYWGAQPHPNFVPLSQEAERLGFDSVWVAESWGNDAFTFAAWVAVVAFGQLWVWAVAVASV